MSYIKNIKNYLNKIEAGGVSDYLINSPIYYYNDDEEEEEEVELLNSKNKNKIRVKEKLFNKKVVDSEVKTTKVKPGDDLIKPVKNVKDNANLMKARIKSRTPQANFKRKKSMTVRRLRVDRD